jgi:hypothetical protein
MRADGWETTAEYTFNHFGDRGSVDVIGWHTAHRALLIVEVKTVLVDVQDVLAALDRKCRVVPPLLARDRGWRARAVGRMLVIRDATAARTVVRRHARTFDSVLPRRATDAREWLRAPGGPIGAVWFMSGTNVGRTRRGARGSAAPG